MTATLAEAPLHPAAGRLEAWLRPRWIEAGSGLVDPSGIDPRSLASTDVVARISGTGLTESDLAHHLLGIEWLAGSGLLPSDIVDLRRSLLADLRARPQLGLDRIRRARRLPGLIGPMTPPERESFRHRLRAAIAARTGSAPVDAAVLACLDRRNPQRPVVGSAIVVTAEACRTWRWRRQLVAHVAGVSFRPAVHGCAADELPGAVEAWSLARQHDLSHSTVHFTTTRVALQQLGPTQRRAVAEAVVAGVCGPASLEATTIALTTALTAALARPHGDPAADIRSLLARRSGAARQV